MELSKKIDPSHVTSKRFGNPSSFSAPKRSKESRHFRKSVARSTMVNEKRDNQPTVSVGSVKEPNKTSEMPSCEHCGRRYWGKCWKLIKGCFRCGSLEHLTRECLKNDGDVLDVTLGVIIANRG